MHVSIDEAGDFVFPNSPTPKKSSVVSFTIPDEYLDDVNKDYLSLKKSWGFSTEVKGSKLNEKQISDVISLLRNHNVLVEIVWLDIATHSKESVEQYKEHQADKLIENLTDKHNENIITHLHAYIDRLKKLPNQLFQQGMITIELMKRILENSPFYYSQSMPKELGMFNWIIDAKDSNVNKINYEEIWSTLLMPILQTNFSMGVLEYGDYSYFSKYDFAFKDMTDFQRSLISKNSIGHTNIKKLISENLSFEESSSIIGLQLVDIIATTFDRQWMEIWDQKDGVT